MAEVLTTDEARVRWITLNRPEKRNALTTQVNDAVRAAVESAPAAGARVVVLTGAGGAFSSGLDLRVAAEEDGSQRIGLDAHPLHSSSAVRACRAPPRRGRRSGCRLRLRPGAGL
jgi:enoyl-CoA hydratase/carnithine racemase